MCVFIIANGSFDLHNDVRNRIYMLGTNVIHLMVFSSDEAFECVCCVRSIFVPNRERSNFKESKHIAQTILSTLY